ncbi:MAG: copper chaperone [Chitinophagaceae bacterium]|nr:copper chaperone [Chitinophagaceae bacterium]
MKLNLRKLTTLAIALFTITAVQAQTTEISDSVLVNGNCGMCKSAIEKSAKEAGATYALWDKKTKVLNLKFDPATTSQEKIEKRIAARGYDTVNFKATDEAYEKLEECCHYDRKNPIFTKQ